MSCTSIDIELTWCSASRIESYSGARGIYLFLLLCPCFTLSALWFRPGQDGIYFLKLFHDSGLQSHIARRSGVREDQF